MPDQPPQNSLRENDYLLQALGQAILTDAKPTPDSVVNPWLTTAGGRPTAERS